MSTPWGGSSPGPQNLLSDVEFAENPEPRCPCILLLDTSGSMSGGAIQSLNEGLISLRKDLTLDKIAERRVEVAIVTFGGDVRVLQDFVTADSFAPPILEANGETPMGTSILTALDLLERRKEVYKLHGLQYYRPWLFLITDGKPQGEPAGTYDRAMQRIKEDQGRNKLIYFPIGVEGADMQLLARNSPTPPRKLFGLRFIELFRWLSASLKSISSSRPGEQAILPPTDPWAIITS